MDAYMPCQFRLLLVALSACLAGQCISDEAIARADEPITYNKHVASILWKNCAGCHRPGEVGPFSLLSYDDAAKRAEFIQEVTSDRRMPPWKAEPDFGCRTTGRTSFVPIFGSKAMLSARRTPTA